MGKGDNRLSPKMRRRKRQRKLKLRARRRADAGKVRKAAKK